MSRCIIHVGMHKTGSTSIQKSLNGFSDGQLVYYEDHKGRSNHGVALQGLVGSPALDNRPFGTSPRLRSGRKPSVDPAVRQSLMSSIEMLQGRDLLLSGEGVMFFSTSDIMEVKRFFLDRFDEVAVVAYVRSPAGYMSSLLQQVIKGGRSRLDVEGAYCNYRRSFGKFDEVFGRANVHLWKFEPRLFPTGCVVRDFCSRLSIALPSERIIRVNESISRQALALLYTYRKFTRNIGTDVIRLGEGKRLAEKLAGLGDGKFRISPDVIRPILEKNRADIEWMEGRLGASLHEELGEYQAGDVRDEADLLTPDPEVVSKLLTLLGDRAPPGVNGKTPKEVALLLHALRVKPMRSVPVESVQAARAEVRRNTGTVMRATPNAIVGWAIGADVERPVRVALVVNGEEVAQVVADKPRPALKARGIHPTGRCGFAFRPEGGKALRAGDEVMVRPLDGDFAIGNSPCKVVARGERETEAVEVEKRE